MGCMAASLLNLLNLAGRRWHQFCGPQWYCMRVAYTLINMAALFHHGYGFIKAHSLICKIKTFWNEFEAVIEI